MSAEEEGEAIAPDVHAIGISFGNSNSSIAYTSGVGKPPPIGIILERLKCTADTHIVS